MDPVWQKAITAEFGEMLAAHPIVGDETSPLHEADTRLQGLVRNTKGGLVCPECSSGYMVLKVDYGFDSVLLDTKRMAFPADRTFRPVGPRVIIREIHCVDCGHDVLSGNANLQHVKQEAR